MAFPYSEADSLVDSFISAEINKLVDEIAWIDKRLVELENSEEDEAERRLLIILRKHLVKDLYELSGFIYSDNTEEESENFNETETVLKAALGEQIVSET